MIDEKQTIKAKIKMLEAKLEAIETKLEITEIDLYFAKAELGGMSDPSAPARALRHVQQALKAIQAINAEKNLATESIAANKQSATDVRRSA